MKVVSSFLIALLLYLTCSGTVHPQEQVLAANVQIPPVKQAVVTEEIMAHINFLAHPARKGRNGKGKYESALYINNWFQKHHLQPFFGLSYYQDVPDLGDNRDEPNIVGRNIGAFIEGTDPVLKKEFIIVNAHYDHLQTRNGLVYPGADDNASGVAMLLEVASILVNDPPKRSVAFVAFDLEEYLLWGSRWFVAHPPIPRDQIKLCVTADMIGRSLGGLDMPTVFVLGSEHSLEVKQIVDSVPVPAGLEVARFGIDMIGTRSDYGPFRAQEIPFLFFSTGEHPDYHKPSDVANKINGPKTASVSNLILSVVQRAANSEKTPKWVEAQPAELAEATAINQVTNHLLNAEEQGEFQLSNVQGFFVSQVQAKTKYMIQRQHVTSEERAWLVRATQLLMLSVF